MLSPRLGLHKERRKHGRKALQVDAALLVERRFLHIALRSALQNEGILVKRSAAERHPRKLPKHAPLVRFQAVDAEGDGPLPFKRRQNFVGVLPVLKFKFCPQSFGNAPIAIYYV